MLEQVLCHRVRDEPASGYVVIDVKGLSGSAAARAAGAHLLAAFSASLQPVIGQLAVPPDANEITPNLQLLKSLPPDDVVITGDAILKQKEICRVDIDGGGDYVFTVKDNQPLLKAHIAFWPFPFSKDWSPPPDLRQAR